MIQTKTLKEALKDPGVIEVVEGLIFQNVLINTFQELDDKLYGTSTRGVIYTFSSPSDYDPDIHPANSGFVEVRKYGVTSTLQRMTTGDGKIFIRTIGAGQNVKWTNWMQV